MFGTDILSVEALGAVSSFVAALLSFVPALGKTDSRRALLAIVTLAAAVMTRDGFEFSSWQTFTETLITAAVYSLVSYKLVLQPLVLPTVAKTFGVEEARG